MLADSPSSTGKSQWMLAIFIGVAFLLRLIFVFQWHASPYGGMPYLDAAVYDEWAQHIAAGHWMAERAFYQSPLLPYVLALLYSLTGHDVLNVALFQAVLSAASCGMLAYAGARLFGTRAMLLTGLLAAFYAPMIFYVGPVLKETLGIFLLSAYLVFAVLALQTNQRRHFAWAGLFLGLAILTRGNALFLLAALPLLAWRNEKKTGHLAVYALGALLAILPVTLHNAAMSHDFVPLTYSSGFNFYIGNREGTNGGNAYPAGIPTADKEEWGTTKIAEGAAGHSLKPSEVSSFWFKKGMDYLLAHPFDAMVLWLKKAALFFSDTEFSDNYNIDFFRQELGTFLSWPIFVGFALVLALSVFAYIGATLEQRRNMQPLVLMATLYMASVLMFYVTDRYRLPVIVFLLPLAGAAATLTTENMKRFIVAMLVAGVVFLASVLTPPKNPMYTMAGWLSLGSLEIKKGDDKNAADHIARGITMAPTIVEPFWYVRAAKAAQRAGETGKAQILINAAIHAYPQAATQIRKEFLQKP
jgi:4-amino-4-deoxy-L-arabinose transferase-like glycosyltransferase